MKRSFLLVLVVLMAGVWPAGASDQASVSRVMPRLLAAAKLGRPVSVGVVEDPRVNAYAEPEAWAVNFYTGLLDKLSSDDELAYVAAHELGHLKRRHTGEKMTNAPLRKPLLPILGIVGGYFGGHHSLEAMATGASVGAGLTQLQYSRSQEREADQEAVAIAAAAGYDPLAGVAVQQVLEKYSGHGPYWFSSHPSNREREGNIRKYAAALPAVRPAPPAIVRKRTILVLFADYLQDPSVMQVFLLAMGDSEKIQILASGPQADAIKQIQEQYGIAPDVTKPDEVYFLSSGAEARQKSGGTSVSTGFGGVAFYRASDKLVADIAATRYDLKSAALIGKPLYGKGEARIYSGSSTSIWLPQGSINWDNQRARSYPQGEALYQAALELRKQFEALPERVQPVIAAAPSRTATHWFPISQGLEINPGTFKVLDSKTKEFVGEVMVTEVTTDPRLNPNGKVARCYIVWGKGPGPDTTVYFP